MKEVWLSVNSSMSDLMRMMRKGGFTVIRAVGGFDGEGKQGWTVLYI